MSVSKRLSMNVLLFLAAGWTVFASGTLEDGYSEAYGGLAARIQPEDVENTGLTAFPALEIPMGGEHEALGTAYTGAARDVTFLEANPAASSDLRYTELGLFHRDLISDAQMEGIAYTTRLEDFGLAVGGKFVHVPFTSVDDFGVQTGTTRYVEAVTAANVSYNFFNSFYFNGVAVGANLKAAYRRLSPGIDDQVRNDMQAVGAMVDAGALTRFNLLKFYSSSDRNFSVGTAFRNVGPNVEGDPLPASWTTGFGYSPVRPVLITSDVQIPFNPFTSVPGAPVGVSAGTAVTVTDFFVVRGGFQLAGGNPRLSMGGSVAIGDLSVAANYTLDMSAQPQPLNRMSVQAGFSLGDRGRGAREERVRELYLDALDAFADGELERTIELSEQVLDIDPTFQPASATLDMAARMQSLQQQMDAIRAGEIIPGAGDEQTGDGDDDSQ